MTSIYTKNALFKKYHYLPDREMRATINEIIAKTRNLPIRIAKFKKKLRPTEVKQFSEVYDLI